MPATAKKISQPIKKAADKANIAANGAAKDVKPDNPQEEQTILETINENAQLTLSFILLLLGSTIITALGLLINDTAIVIGGMIISPLMWPLLKTALSISYGYKRSITSTLTIVAASMLIVFLGSALLAYISPLKSTTNEIMDRTSPSFFHIIIGLAGGGVATLALTKKRISTSLAGVAVATSLQPPLVTSAIGFALGEWQIFSRAFILFVTNATSIIFIAVITFSLIGFRRTTGNNIRNKGLIITAVALIILAIPLISFLRQQSFETLAYQQVRSTLQSELETIHPDITLENTVTRYNRDNRDIIDVTATLLLPENVTLSFTEQQQLSRTIEQTINREVNLQLHLQRQISLLSETDIAFQTVKDHLEQLFTQKISADYPTFSIDSLNISNENQNWELQAVLRGNPLNAPTINELNALQTYLSEQIGPKVNLTIEVIPLVRLETNEEKIISEIHDVTQTILTEQSNNNVHDITIQYESIPQSATISAQIDTQNDTPPIATATATRNIQTRFTFPIDLNLIFTTASE